MRSAQTYTKEKIKNPNAPLWNSVRLPLQQQEGRNDFYRLQYYTAALGHATTSEEIAKLTVDLGAETLRATAGTIWLFDKYQELQLVASRGYAASLLAKVPSFRKKGTTTTLDAIRTKKPILIRSWEDRKRLYPQTASAFKQEENQAFIAIPLLMKNDVLGAVNFSFRTDKVFFSEELEFIYTLVQQCAQALDRAKLYEDEKSQRERIQALQELTGLLSQALTPAEIVKVVINKAITAIGASAGEISLWNKDKKIFLSLMYGGRKEKNHKKQLQSWQEVRAEGSMLYLDAIVKKQAIFIEDVLKLPQRYKLAKKFYKLSGLRGEAIIPFERGQEMWGIFSLFFKLDQTNFNQENKDFIIALAHQIEQAYIRANFYEQKDIYAKEVEKREARFHSLIENSNDAIILISKSLHILFRSASSERITGENPKERIGKPVLDVVDERDRKKVKMWLEQLIHDKDNKPSTIIFRRIKNGEKEQWIEATGTNALNKPEIGAIVVNYRDVTYRIEAERKLKESRDELHVVLESIGDSVIVFTRKGEVLYANPAALKMNQSTSEKLYTTPFHQYAKEKFDAIDNEQGENVSFDMLPFAKSIKSKHMETGVFHYILKETKEEQWRRVTSTPVFDAKGQVSFVVSVSQDISLQKEKERVKDEFISTASHELKTPITSAVLYTNLLSKRLQEEKDSKSYELLTKITIQLQRLTKLINDLLDITRINAGKVQFHKEKIFIDMLLKEVIEEMQYTTATHALHLHGKSNQYILADRERMRQVLINLLSNAIKYSPHGKKIDITIATTKKNVEICIKDYGIGISSKNHRKIFQPFFRESHKNIRFPGLGLGLHISSEIIRRLQGSIAVKSSPGRGTTFCFTLPIVNE